MLLIIGGLLAIAALGIFATARVHRRTSNNLGAMSEQWLAEHRASHPS